MAITIRFERVRARRIHIRTFCRRCKKNLYRNVSEEQTVNPWNTIEEDGIKRPKSRQEVWQSCEDAVKQHVKTLETKGTYCRKCEELGTPAIPRDCING